MRLKVVSPSVYAASAQRSSTSRLPYRSLVCRPLLSPSTYYYFGSRVLVTTYTAAVAQTTASTEHIDLNPPRPPHKNAIEAFVSAELNIDTVILKSWHHGENHQPRMWSRAQDVPDHPSPSTKNSSRFAAVHPHMTQTSSLRPLSPLRAAANLIFPCSVRRRMLLTEHTRSPQPRPPIRSLRPPAIALHRLAITSSSSHRAAVQPPSSVTVLTVDVRAALEELVTCMTVTLPDDGDVQILWTDTEDDLADIDTSDGALSVSPSATRTDLCTGGPDALIIARLFRSSPSFAVERKGTGKRHELIRTSTRRPPHVDGVEASIGPSDFEDRLAVDMRGRQSYPHT